MKKLLTLLLTLCALCVPALAAEGGQRDIVILHTNDIHGKYESYTKLAACRAELAEESYVALVDAGDFSQGEAAALLSEGAYLVELANAVGYDIVVPGNHEFDYGMDRALENLNALTADVLACNFVDLRTGETVFAPYTLKEYGETSVAYVGISTPQTYTKSTPVYFQNEQGEFVYSFCEKSFAETVQAAVDGARAAGADYVVAVGHLGVNEASSPWTSRELIAATEGIDIFIDGHSHTQLCDPSVPNKAGQPVVLTQTGTKFDTFGKVVIRGDGSITAELIADYEGTDPGLDAAIADINSRFAAYTETVVASCEVRLNMDDGNGTRLVRNSESNLGDLVADAHRVVMDVDAAIVNGGSIRANLEPGEVTVRDILAVMPFGNEITVARLTGQQILDCLEKGATFWPQESGGFCHVSGLTYTVDSSIESSVVLDDMGFFVEVAGPRRVTDVRIGGEPLRPEESYTVACNSYWLLTYGDGMSMFRGCEILEEKSGLYLDNVLLVRYLQEHLGGVVTAAQYGAPAGRITLRSAEAPAAPAQPEQPAPALYTVVEGDCLWSIARRTLGSGARWQELYQLNREQIPRPERIYAGQQLVLPAA